MKIDLKGYAKLIDIYRYGVENDNPDQSDAARTQLEAELQLGTDADLASEIATRLLEGQF